MSRAAAVTGWEGESSGARILTRRIIFVAIASVFDRKLTPCVSSHPSLPVHPPLPHFLSCTSSIQHPLQPPTLLPLQPANFDTSTLASSRPRQNAVTAAPSFQA